MATLPSSLCCCFFLRLKAISSRMTPQKNEEVLDEDTHLGPAYTYWFRISGAPSYAVPGTSLRKGDFPLHPAETKKEPSRNDGEEGECLEGLASPPSPWHMGHKCKALAGSPRTRSSPPGSGIRREGNWQGCSALSLGRLVCPAKPDGRSAALMAASGGLASQAWLKHSGNQLLSQLRKCQRVLLPSVAESKQLCVRERPLSPEPRKPWYECWQCHW